jgi:hypothetical protein
LFEQAEPLAVARSRQSVDCHFRLYRSGLLKDDRAVEGLAAASTAPRKQRGAMLT